MNTSVLLRTTRLACLALAALLSACGGGGGADPASPTAPVVATSPAGASAAAPVAVPSLADTAATTSPVLSAALPVADNAGWAEVAEAQGYLVASTEIVVAGGEHQYPDLRMLPTQVIPFEPVVVGDVSAFAVADAR
ncbi:MAG: hypothetical protein ABIT83_25750 [Massilia sp.]